MVTKMNRRRVLRGAALAGAGAVLGADRRVAEAVDDEEPSQEEPAVEWLDPRIVRSGWWHEGRYQTSPQVVDWYTTGVVIENPNLNVAVSDVRIVATAYDESGAKLSSTLENVSWLHPGAQTLVSHSFHVVGDKLLASVGFEVETDFRPTDPLIVEQARLTPGITGGQTVEAVVRNPWPRGLNTVRVMILLYDATDTMVGATSVDVDDLPAFGTRPLRQYTATGDTAVRAEMTAAPTFVTKFV